MKRTKKHNRKNTTRSCIQKSMNEKAMLNMMTNEVEQILRTTDFSKIDVSIFTDDLKRRFIIPKAVFALATVDAQVMNWLLATVNMHPEYGHYHM